MNWVGGGFVPIINYAAGGGAFAASNAILAEDGSEILTEASDYLEYET